MVAASLLRPLADGMTIAALMPLWPELAAIDPALHSQLETDCRYQSYVQRQQTDIDALRRDEAMSIPVDLDYRYWRSVIRKYRYPAASPA